MIPSGAHSSPLRIVHVDDDIKAIGKLERQLRVEPDVVYLGGFAAAEEALSFLQQQPADLIFLDVEMPGKDGLWLAGELHKSNSVFAFITAYTEYAARAFEVCALEYLLKPVSDAQLRIVLEHARHPCDRGSHSTPQQVAAVREYLDPRQRPSRIFTSSGSKVNVVDLDQVMYFGASLNFTTIAELEGVRHTSPKTLRTFEEALKNHPDFLRISRSFIINKKFVKSISRNPATRKVSLLLANDETLETTFKTMEELMGRLAM